MTTTSRSLKLDLFTEDRQPVLNSIRRYRAMCRQMYGMLAMAQSAGAEIEEHEGDVRVKPANDKAKLILASACDGLFAIEKGDKVARQGQGYNVRIGAGFGYEMRSLFFRHWPTAKAFVWDSLRRDLSTVWAARDPEFPQATRGWLTLQGARKLAFFNWRGIGFPVATARPTLAHHSIELDFDRDIGKVKLTFGRLDEGRHATWKAILSGHYPPGTVYLNERDGKLFSTISYDMPDRTAELDPNRVLEVRFEPEDLTSFLRIVGPDKQYDTASAASIVGLLARLKKRSERIEARRAACGSPRQPWGVRRGSAAERDLLAAVTQQRTRIAADWNHAWSRRIVARAEGWRCGTVRCQPRPENLFGHPWQWSQFVEFIRYKAGESGVVVDANGEGAIASAK